MTSEKITRSTAIEKDWITKAGLRAVVLFVYGEHRCGYVGIPVGHPLHGAKYSDPHPAIIPPGEDEPVGKRSAIALFCLAASDDPARFTSPEIAFDVHGGLTFSGAIGEHLLSASEWWLGFDCAHYGDAKSPEYYEDMRARYPDTPILWERDDGIFRSQEYVEQECEQLAAQIVQRTRAQEPS